MNVTIMTVPKSDAEFLRVEAMPRDLRRRPLEMGTFWMLFRNHVTQLIVKTEVAADEI